jgi:hypothetical protein
MIVAVVVVLVVVVFVVLLDPPDPTMWIPYSWPNDNSIVAVVLTEYLFPDQKRDTTSTEVEDSAVKK